MEGTEASAISNNRSGMCSYFHNRVEDVGCRGLVAYLGSGQHAEPLLKVLSMFYTSIQDIEAQKVEFRTLFAIGSCCLSKAPVFPPRSSHSYQSPSPAEASPMNSLSEDRITLVRIISSFTVHDGSALRRCIRDRIERWRRLVGTALIPKDYTSELIQCLSLVEADLGSSS